MSLEYLSLRAEIQDRGARRFSTLTLVIAAAAVAVGSGDVTVHPLEALIAGLLALCAVANWAYGGRVVGQLGDHLADLELRINTLIAVEGGDPHPLRWELTRQDLRRDRKLHRVVLGSPADPVIGIGPRRAPRGWRLRPFLGARRPQRDSERGL
jgi:hypothetical protein